MHLYAITIQTQLGAQTIRTTASSARTALRQIVACGYRVRQVTRLRRVN